MSPQALVARPQTPAPAPAPARRAAGDRLARLLSGWPEESIEVPSQAVIRSVDCTLALLAPLTDSPTADRLIPSLEGGISIVFERGRRYADLTFLNSGEVALTLSSATGEARPARSVAHPPIEALGQIRDLFAAPIR